MNLFPQIPVSVVIFPALKSMREIDFSRTLEIEISSEI